MSAKLPRARVVRGDIRVPPPLRKVPGALRRKLLYGDAWAPLCIVLVFLVSMVNSDKEPTMTTWLVFAGFITVAIVQIVRAIAKGRRTIALLAHGVVVRGTEIERAVLPGDSDSSERHKVTFEYTPVDGEPRTHVVTTPYDETVIGGDMQMVHSPSDPSQALVLATLPGDVQIFDGTIDFRLRYLDTLPILPCVALGLAATITVTLICQ